MAAYGYSVCSKWYQSSSVPGGRKVTGNCHSDMSAYQGCNAEVAWKGKTEQGYSEKLEYKLSNYGEFIRETFEKIIEEVKEVRAAFRDEMKEMENIRGKLECMKQEIEELKKEEVEGEEEEGVLEDGGCEEGRDSVAINGNKVEEHFRVSKKDRDCTEEMGVKQNPDEKEKAKWKFVENGFVKGEENIPGKKPKFFVGHHDSGGSNCKTHRSKGIEEGMAGACGSGGGPGGRESPDIFTGGRKGEVVLQTLVPWR